MSGREIAMMGNCNMCDSYFINVVGVVKLSERRGAKGKELLGDQYGKLQEKFTNKLELLHCPTCSELVYEFFQKNI
jgi:hypothetical protein